MRIFTKANSGSLRLNTESLSTGNFYFMVVPFSDAGKPLIGLSFSENAENFGACVSLGLGDAKKLVEEIKNAIARVEAGERLFPLPR